MKETQEINFKAAGICSEDIRVCDSHETLLEWKITLDAENAAVTSQIVEAKAKARGGDYSDAGWYSRITHFRRVLGFLSQQIQVRMGQLRRKHTNSKNDDFGKLFMGVAKRFLSPSMYEHLIQETKLMNSEQEVQECDATKLPGEQEAGEQNQSTQNK